MHPEILKAQPPPASLDKSLRSRVPNAALVILLAAYAALAAGFSITIPLGEAPDEVSHFAYVQYLSTHRQLPPPDGPAAGESHQPPLYYLIGALSTAWILPSDWQVIANPDYPSADPQPPNLVIHTRSEAFPYQGAILAWHLVRLLSVLMGIVTVAATYGIAKILFPDDRWLALASAAFVAFLPAFEFISGMANNDNLVIMLSACTVFQVLRMLNHPISVRDCAALGALLGLAALTKLSGLVLWPFAFALLILHAYRSRAWTRSIRISGLVFGVAILVDLPWMVFNQLSFGDPIGWAKVVAITPPRISPMSLEDWSVVIEGLFTSFAGRFGGGLQLSLPDSYYWLFGLSLLLPFIGWVNLARDERDGKVARGKWIGLILAGLFWIFLLAAYVRWTTTALGTDQARQLFPGLPFLAIFLMVGAARLLPGGARAAAIVVAVTGAVLTFGILLYLRQVYTLPVQVGQIDPSPSRSDFGRIIRVLGSSIIEKHVSPGDPIAVQIDWQAISATDEDYWLQLQLVGSQGPIADKDGIPSAGRRTTDWWERGQVLSSRHTIVVPPDAPKGAYKLVLGLHPFGRWDWLPVEGRERLVLGEVSVD